MVAESVAAFLPCHKALRKANYPFHIWTQQLLSFHEKKKIYGGKSHKNHKQLHNQVSE
jgi:hypothetical protein